MKFLSFSICLLLVSSSAFSKKESNFFPRSFKASLILKSKTTLNNKTKKNNGFLEYQYPGKTWLEVEKPSRIVYVTNQKKIWFYRAAFLKGEPGTLTKNAKGHFALTKLLDSLKFGMVSNKIYTVKKIKNYEYELLFLNDKVNKIGFKKAFLSFSKKKSKRPFFANLEQIELRDLKNNKVEIEFSKINLNKKFSKGHFSFKAPANTRTSR
jgi:outer membrane lipoprotein-sorting protein